VAWEILVCVVGVRDGGAGGAGGSCATVGAAGGGGTGATVGAAGAEGVPPPPKTWEKKEVIGLTMLDP
jgi:hypothetical protein